MSRAASAEQPVAVVEEGDVADEARVGGCRCARATPTAVDTTPSMPLAPRLARTVTPRRGSAVPLDVADGHRRRRPRGGAPAARPPARGGRCRPRSGAPRRPGCASIAAWARRLDPAPAVGPRRLGGPVRRRRATAAQHVRRGRRHTERRGRVGSVQPSSADQDLDRPGRARATRPRPSRRRGRRGGGPPRGAARRRRRRGAGGRRRRRPRRRRPGHRPAGRRQHRPAEGGGDRRSRARRPAPPADHDHPGGPGQDGLQRRPRPADPRPVRRSPRPGSTARRRAGPRAAAGRGADERLAERQVEVDRPGAAARRRRRLDDGPGGERARQVDRAASVGDAGVVEPAHGGAVEVGLVDRLGRPDVAQLGRPVGRAHDAAARRPGGPRPRRGGARPPPCRWW